MGELATISTILVQTRLGNRAAVYGIRMQGDFAGTAERCYTRYEQFTTLRGVVADDALSFDTLTRRARRVTSLLTSDLASWRQTLHARLLALPG